MEQAEERIRKIKHLLEEQYGTPSRGGALFTKDKQGRPVLLIISPEGDIESEVPVVPTLQDINAPYMMLQVTIGIESAIRQLIVIGCVAVLLFYMAQLPLLLGAFAVCYGMIELAYFAYASRAAKHECLVRAIDVASDMPSIDTMLEEVRRARK